MIMKVFSMRMKTFAVMVCATLAMATNANADVNRQAALLIEQAEALNCAADKLKDEIKAHFRSSRNYGKMISTTARIRSRSAAVARRVKRKSHYRSLCRDVEKLNELTCELNTLYREAILRVKKGKDRPIFANTYHVMAQIRSMQQTSDFMLGVAKGEVILVGEVLVDPDQPAIQEGTVYEDQQFGIQEIVPNNQVAPGPVTPEFQSPGVRLNRPWIESASPIDEPRPIEPHSVLRRPIGK